MRAASLSRDSMQALPVTVWPEVEGRNKKHARRQNPQLPSPVKLGARFEL
jgi:hypothetical protein